MDFIRSCYSAPMKFFRDDAGREVTVRWSFVDENVPGMPWAHAFGSRVWDVQEDDPPPIGEQDAPRKWFGGEPPYPLPMVGPLGSDDLGLCGSEEQWQSGALTTDPLAGHWPGGGVPRCCKKPALVPMGGVAWGNRRPPGCRMDSTFDSFSPFGGAPVILNAPCKFFSDLPDGRGTFPLNVVCWTHFMDVDVAENILDGCSRTLGLDAINYADGDEIRIPSGGTTRYVVVWVSLCDVEGTVVKRVYMMRHSL